MRLFFGCVYSAECVDCPAIVERFAGLTTLFRIYKIVVNCDVMVWAGGKICADGKIVADLHRPLHGVDSLLKVFSVFHLSYVIFTFTVVCIVSV